MLRLSTTDKDSIDEGYDSFLENLYNYLKNSRVTCGVEYSKMIIRLLHEGMFSMNGDIICTNDYDYLHLPNLCSDGALVMYGVCCCRHATSLLYDVLNGLGFDVSLQCIRVCDDSSWKRATYDTANHIVVVLRENSKTYYLDAINKFILELLENGDFKQIESTRDEIYEFSDENVTRIGKVLSKYYDLKRLGIEYVYGYDYDY